MELVEHVLGRGVFPARYAWFLEGGWQAAMLRRLRTKSMIATLIPVRGDAGELPFESGSIDVVIAVTVLGEVTSAESTIGEVHRVLRPGGTFSVSEHWPDPDFLRFEQVTALCEANGFRLDHRFGTRHNYTANFIASEARRP